MGEIKPSREWVLSKTDNGQFLTQLFDYERGTTKSYDVLQSERGENINFILHPLISAEKGVNTGDTIGVVYSSKVERRLSQLNGDLKVSKAKLKSAKEKANTRDIELRSSEIEAIEQEIGTLMDRKESFTIISPFNGLISQFLPIGVLFSIYDTSSYVILMSIPSEYMKYLASIKKIKYSSGIKRDSIDVRLFFVSNERKNISGREAGMAKAVIRGNSAGISPGMTVECSIDCKSITVLEYIKRFFARMIT